MRTRSTLALAALVTALGAQAASAVVLWDNGPLITGPVTRSGVAAPAGQVWSELASGNTSNGASVHNTGTGGFRVADNFTLPVASNLTSLTAFTYTTGSALGAVYTVGNIRLWSGRPGDAGSVVVFGDTTTDRLTSSVATNILRCFATTVPAGGVVSTPDTTRTIKASDFTLENILLAAGTYWVDYQINPLTAGGTVFHPTTTYLVDRNLPTDNGRQFITTGVWQDLLDAGNPASLPDVPLDLAFRIDGTPIPEPASLGALALAAVALYRRRP